MLRRRSWREKKETTNHFQPTYGRAQVSDGNDRRNLFCIFLAVGLAILTLYFSLMRCLRMPRVGVGEAYVKDEMHVN